MTMIINIPEQVLLIKVTRLGDHLGATTGFVLVFYDVTQVVSQDADAAGKPTANLRLAFEHKLIPANGVYVSRVQTPFGNFDGVTNIGMRPTVGRDTEIHIETHIFDFDGMLYDETITVEIMQRLREEQKFESVEVLRMAIENDCRKAKEWLKEQH
jgi:FAD synthase